MDSHPLNPDARSLEEAFFAKKNAESLEKLRQKVRQEERRQAMREAVPNADDALVDHLLDIGLNPETVLALVLVPMLFVAWADGSIDGRERAAHRGDGVRVATVVDAPAHRLLVVAAGGDQHPEGQRHDRQAEQGGADVRQRPDQDPPARDDVPGRA